MKGLNKKLLFTKTPNVLIDQFLPTLTGSEWLIITIIIRKSIGFQKNGDTISLSQFEKSTGLVRNTVKDAIEGIIKKGLVSKTKSGNLFRYAIDQEYLLNRQNLTLSNNDNENSIEIDPDEGQNLYPLKETVKKTQKNTSTNFISDDFQKICNKWNELFDNTLDEKDEFLKKLVFKAMEKFSVEQLIQAIFYRSKADYYHTKAFHLRTKPKSFFKYHDTIANDLRRKSDNIFTYHEMVDKVGRENLDMDQDFQKIEEFKDENGKKYWEYKRV